VAKKTLYVDSNTIITPSAKDAAAEFNIIISFGCPTSVEKACNETVNSCKIQTVDDDEKIDMDLVYRIVKEMLNQSKASCSEVPFVKECDASGLQLIKADTVKCEPFETGNPKEKIGMMDIVTVKESPHMGAGFMTIDHCDFNWTLNYEEFDYIVEGNLDITIDGKTYKGKPGDVFYIPKDSSITWSASEFVKIFYTTYPANWAELAANK
jgi:ethanolamine utilization protein EutQ